MGKKNTTRQRRMSKRNTRKLTKRNRSRKTRGGGDIGERIDFSKKLEDGLINKKISYCEKNLGFCTALHVCLFDTYDTDKNFVFFFFYNYTPQNDLKKNSSSFFGNARAFISRQIGKIALIRSNTAKFLQEIAKNTRDFHIMTELQEEAYAYNGSDYSLSLSTAVEFKEDKDGRLDDTSDKKFDIFKKGYNGIFFAYTQQYNCNSKPYKQPSILYKHVKIENADKSIFNRKYCVFTFEKIEDVINNFNFKDVSTYKDKENPESNILFYNRYNRESSGGQNQVFDVFEAEFYTRPRWIEVDEVIDNANHDLEYNSIYAYFIDIPKKDYTPPNEIKSLRLRKILSCWPDNPRDPSPGQSQDKISPLLTGPALSQDSTQDSSLDPIPPPLPGPGQSQDSTQDSSLDPIPPPLPAQYPPPLPAQYPPPLPAQYPPPLPAQYPPPLPAQYPAPSRR